MKEFTADSINYLVWGLGIEFEVALTDGGELNFDKSFLHFNVKKKNICKSYFDCKYWVQDTASLNSSFNDSYNNTNFYLHLTFLNEKNKILQDVKKPPCEASLFNFHRVKLCKRAEVNNEPSHLWFSIFRVRSMQLPVSWAAPASRFLGTLKNTIYLQIILVTSRIICSLKLKAKTEVSICGVANINIKRKQ